MGKILLYYKYVTVEDPEAIVAWQKEFCNALKLKGRIIVATEGINGTVGGSLEATTAYREALDNHPLFHNIDFKESDGGAEDFPRLRVVVRDEIVTLGIAPAELGVQDGGKHLTPKEVHELLQNKPSDLVVLDGRNKYEANIGKFNDAIVPPIKAFSEFPRYIDQNIAQFKDKKVLMYCTGGVRCERATAYLKTKGVQEVYQIDGGIHRYVEQYPDGFFRGKNYVFDDRLALEANKDVLGQCDFCKTPSDAYTNCVNMSCNKKVLACIACLKKWTNTCSASCFDLARSGKVTVRTHFRKGSEQPSL